MQDFIMGNGYYNIVATVLLVMNLERTRSLQGFCNCSAGTFCGKSSLEPCISCPLNSFSSTSGQKSCDICRKCEGLTSQIIIFFLALTSAAMLCLATFVFLRFSVVKQGRKKLLYIFKQPFMRPVQTAQEEDACSCRFPEEEEGECEL
ncbi:hypothetical protein MJG53_011141 [Ovis ammon polii x Ovis aries]|uniref:Uncharacterized protein n=1 Tax=Ovis ammon polii x Ovis aries TaxID=2918886 RepID=A0ACB9URK5_9CETA|nr:hypothetical protein MJG53_011141 [Ovis ammon polii x Ovis aries]